MISKLVRIVYAAKLNFFWNFFFCSLLLIGSTKLVSADDYFRIVDNDPSWYVYMQFDGYHEQFYDFKPLFLEEIKKQNLMIDLKGNCFNVYFSEKDWAIGCRIQNKTDVQLPLTIEYCKNKKFIIFPYDGPANKIVQFLDFASIHITKNNFYWDGPLIIDNVSNKPNDTSCELIIPLTRDYYKIFIKPYGITRVVITFLCFLFAIFLLTYKKGRVLRNRILGVLMLCYVLLNCESFLWIYNMVRDWPHLYDFSISLSFLLGPLLLFYTRSVVFEKFKLRKVHILHLVPFLTVAIVYFFIFQIYDKESKLDLLDNGFSDSLFFEVTYILEELHLISYLLVSIFYVFRHQLLSKHVFLKAEKVLINTLKFLLIGLVFLAIVEIVRDEVPIEARIHYAIKGICILLYLLMISTLLIRCLRHPEIFAWSGRNSNGNGNGQKYLKSPLTGSHISHYLQKIELYMDEAKPYLSSTINLTDFARHISIPSRYISQVINEELEMSFYDLINKYRIEEAKRFLSNSEYNNCSIIDIAYDCGFNTKSVFNAAFKKHTGVTPSIFRMKQQMPVSIQ